MKYNIYYDGNLVEVEVSDDQVRDYLRNLGLEFFEDNARDVELYGDTPYTDEDWISYAKGIIRVTVDVDLGEFL